MNLVPWHALQDCIAQCANAVVIPYARSLANHIPAVATRLRRDFTSLLNLIRAHALLHRANREADKNGAVIATIQDYAAVRDLTADLFSEGVKASVSSEVRETVEAVKQLLRAERKAGVSITELSGFLELDKSTVSRSVQEAQHDNYLLDLETVKGKPACLILGEALPDDIAILPPTEALMT